MHHAVFSAVIYQAIVVRGWAGYSQNTVETKANTTA
jgi:hypothetical protein